MKTTTVTWRGHAVRSFDNLGSKKKKVFFIKDTTKKDAKAALVIYWDLKGIDISELSRLGTQDSSAKQLSALVKPES